MARKAKVQVDNGLTHNHYNSISEMKAAIVQPFRLAHNATIDHKNIDGMGDRRDWYGIDGGAAKVREIVGMTHEPVEKLMRDFHAKLGAKIPRAVGISRSIVRDSTGDSLDYHSMLRGNHDRAWVSSKRRLKRGHGIIRLVVDIGGNCNSSAEKLQWRGVAGLTLAETLTKAGYSVEIVAGFAVESHTNNYSDKATITCTVKPRNGAVNYGVLSSTIGLTGFFRVYGFAAIIKDADKRGSTVSGNLGHIVALSNVLPVPEKVTQFIVPQDVSDDRTATAWVQDTIKLLQLTGE